jgi:hypothetical protein
MKVIGRDIIRDKPGQMGIGNPQRVGGNGFRVIGNKQASHLFIFTERPRIQLR